MNDKYNGIGKTYNHTRKADPRIFEKIRDELQLEPGSKILDIGAGTGNYSYELAKMGFEVTALEPSEVMLNQGKKHEKIKWVQGVAEDVPFDEGTFHGVICILSTHHFQNLRKSFYEIKRVLKGNGVAVIFTQDPRLCPNDFWYHSYFHDIIEKSYTFHPSANQLKEMLAKVFQNNVEMTTFLIPYDLEDGFFFSAWRYPKRFLDMTFCDGISSLAETPKDILIQIQTKLSDDLNSGSWKSKYGDILYQKEYDFGYFFLRVKNSSRARARRLPSLKN
ncbi:MAG TPA: class I SAM-dependent methyltransferase [Bacillota bacterium]|nr:class I SAM-dependent methyltransferase [Bacillota bacterium]